MSKVYIPQPTVEEMMKSYTEYLVRIFRVKIIYTIQHKNGNYECVEIANPDEA
jgi:membrane-anchored glycerophosphoryl diester phosphodiesterase (GDPDase)